MTEHVRAQNWTAAALDFVIVVVGVFIGLQVANWNDARGEQRLGEDYLHGFRADLLADREMLETEIRARRNQHSDAKAVLDFFDERPFEPNAFFSAYYSSISARAMRPNRNTLEEVLNSGNLRLISDPAFRTGLLDLYAMYDGIRFLEDHIARDVERYLYDTTFSIVAVQFEGPWEDSEANRAAADALLSNVTIENGFRLIVVNLELNGDGLIGDLEEARAQVNELLQRLPSD